MLPSITIKYKNGQLGTVPESQDGLLALALIGATEVAGKFTLGTAYKIYRPDGLEELGVESTKNAVLVKLVSQFYAEAPEGTPLIVVGYESTETMTALCDKTTGKLKALIESQGGDLRGVVLASTKETDAKAVTEGLDSDVFTALTKAQELFEYSATQLYAPVFVALEGLGFTTAAALKDLSKESYNGCCVVIGDVTVSSKHAAMGTFAGRVAKSAVQRTIGRVADGALAPLQMFIGTKAAESAMDDITTIYDKGYISPRKYVGRTGYFFTDDKMACKPTDDYAHLTARRTVDKAVRIAYDTLLEKLLDELEINENGTVSASVVKSWQADVESAIDDRMTANAELSAVNGSGCSCFIDPNQKIVSTGKIVASLGVRPFGYSRMIDAEIGFIIKQ